MVFFYIAVIVLLVISGICSASETAVTGSSPGKMHKLKSEGSNRAALVVKLLKNKSRLISSLLVANTIVNIFSTSLVTSLFIDVYGEQGTAYASFFMSVVIIIFGEVLPKAIAVIHPEKIALAIAPLLNTLVLMMTPINALLNLIIKGTALIFNISKEQVVSATEEVRGMIEYQLEEGNVFKSDRDMLGGVLDLSSITVADIMTHRSHMFTINADLPLEEITKQALNTPFTRIPLWRDDKDNIVGVLHLRSLLKALHDNNFNYLKLKLDNFLTEPWFIPENVQVNLQLSEFRKRRNHFAIVVDEYGALRGVVTLEDAVEEIVGQIEDEHDIQRDLIVKQGENKYIIEGEAPIRDVNRELDWNLPDEDASTIAGLIMHETGRIPDEGEEFKLFNLKMTILRRQANRIRTLLVELIEPKEERVDDK
ncbi:MAG: Hemolysin-like protein [Rickettsiaceae bacterium]|jgi:Mg2+/Co2+ transporter CorB|nr:Hemolysin-like protein [Rickettsiaceae bacterium]